MTERMEKLPEHPMLGRTIVRHDERSKDFPVRGVLFAEDAPLVSKGWRRPGPYDQGQTSMCVGYTVKGVIMSQPITAMIPLVKRKIVTAPGIYKTAQEEFDEWPGAEPDYYGTSTLAGFKAAHKAEVIPGYRWCFGLDDVLKTLSHWGPVAIGIPWDNDMFEPDANGFVKPGGGNAGGHDLELHKVNVEKEYVEGTNSWGLWGPIKGRFRMTFDVLEERLNNNGEAVTVAPTPTA